MKIKEELLIRYFQLEKRIDNLKRISEYIFVCDWQKRKRINKLMKQTKFKHRILENHLIKHSVIQK